MNTKFKQTFLFKVALVLLLPIILATILGGYLFSDQSASLEGARNDAAIVAYTEQFADLSHALAIERGLTAGVLTTPLKRASSELLEAQQRVDSAFELLLQMVAENIDVIHRIEGASSQFDLRQLSIEVDTLRQRASHRQEGDATSIFHAYSAVIESALKRLHTITSQLSHNTLTQYMERLYQLYWLEEHAGRERGQLNTFFISGQISPQASAEVTHSIRQQDLLQEDFITNATVDLQQQFRAAIDEEIQQQIRHYRNLFLSRLKKQELLNELNSLLGFGGTIHSFKNYIISGLERDRHLFEHSSNQALSVLQRYRELEGVTASELKNLRTIEESLQQYRNSMVVASSYSGRNGDLIRQIDHEIKIDDRQALLALKHLTKQDGVDAAAWFSSASRRIDHIHQISTSAHTDLAHYSQQIILQLQANADRAVLWLALISLPLLIAIGYFWNYISSSVGNMVEAIQKIGESDDLSTRIPVVRQDEMGVIAGALNQLLDNLQETSEIKAASQAKDQFLASMSHELRTPLTAIIGCSELLNKSELNQQQQKLGETIALSSNNLLALVNDILDLSKITAGKFEVDYAPYALPTLLQQVESIFASKATSEGLRFQVVQKTTPEYKLWGDDKRITQILLNLISNALKFTEQGGITLTCWREADQLCFAVEDSGIGMSAEVLERLFQPFEQASSGISRKFGGTGLGLHISKSLAEMMEGSIHASSEEGKGSRFELVLPYRESELRFTPSTDQPETRKHSAARFTGKVLIAEDAPELQMLERQILESMGATVTVADHGEEALRLALEEEFDLILMDMQMPVMDGITATRSLRELGSETPIAALTANVMQSHKEQFQQAGCSEFLTKPIDRIALQKVVARYLKLDEGDDELQSSDTPHKSTPQQADQVTCGRILAIDDELSVLDLYETIFGDADNSLNSDLDDLSQLSGSSSQQPQSAAASLHCKLSIASQGAVGIEMVKDGLKHAEPYSVAFIDMRMPPGIDGLATAQELRKLDPNIYIVFVTAHSDVSLERINQKLRYGVLYVSKPFSKLEIQQIAHMLNQQWIDNHKKVGSAAHSQSTQPNQADTQEEVDISTTIDDALMTLFFNRTRELEKEFKGALEGENWIRAKEIAHTIKGSGTTFGYPSLTHLADTFCKAYNSGDTDQLPQMGRLLLDEVEAAQR